MSSYIILNKCPLRSSKGKTTKKKKKRKKRKKKIPLLPSYFPVWAWILHHPNSGLYYIINT